MDLIITHDTEDVYTPEQYGFDEVPKRLAEIYTEEGVPANFMVIAQRARLLKDRGREDVLAAMRQQFIGVHTLWDAAPYDSVAAAKHEWAEGLEIVRQMQTQAYREVAESFDVEPVCLSAHAFNSAPHQHVVARELGLPFMYGYPTPPPLYNMSRYCGAFNFGYVIVPTETELPYFEGFDDALSSQPEFEAHLERFAEKIDACVRAGQPAMLMHPAHPFKIYSLDWVDFYVSPNGRIIPPEEWPRRRQAGVRSWGQVELALRNFRRLVQFIKHHPDLNPISVPEAVKKYGRVPDQIGRLDLYAAAQRTCATRSVALDGAFTPAEIAIGLARALLAFRRHGALPEAVQRDNDCLGPLEEPLITPEEPCDAGPDLIAELAASLLRAVERDRCLPANLRLPDGSRIGLGSVYHALSRAYVAVVELGKLPEALDLWRFDREPALGHLIGLQFYGLAQSQLVEPNLDYSRLYRHGKLQTWTLAPAWTAS